MSQSVYYTAISNLVHCFLLIYSDVTSEQSAITLNVYDRASEDQGFLGTLQVKPVFVHEHTLDHWYKYVPIS